jgi:hypothetical protein
LYRSRTLSSHIVSFAIMLSILIAFTFGAATPATALSARKRAVVRTIKAIARKKHLGVANTAALLKICRMESGYSPGARNHSCKGLFQLMTRSPRRKWANVRWNTTTAIKYIRQRYGSARAALRFHYRHGWY